MCRRTEYCTIVIFHDCEPDADIGGMVFADFGSYPEHGAKEGGSQFCHEFFVRINTVSEGLSEFTLQTALVSCPMRELTLEFFVTMSGFDWLRRLFRVMGTAATNIKYQNSRDDDWEGGLILQTASRRIAAVKYGELRSPRGLLGAGAVSLIGPNPDRPTCCARLPLAFGIPSPSIFLLPPPASFDVDAIRKAVRFIHLNIHKPFGLRKIVELSGIPQKKFERYFRGTVGVGPSSFINLCRIERACASLKSKKKRTILQIATLTGFRSPGHFRSVFRRFMGLTPAAFRRQRCKKHSLF